MKPRDIIWTTMMLAFVTTVGVGFRSNALGFGSSEMGTGEWAVLLLSVLAVGLLSRWFVHKSFDKDGRWEGRIVRRRADED